MRYCNHKLLNVFEDSAQRVHTINYVKKSKIEFPLVIQMYYPPMYIDFQEFKSQPCFGFQTKFQYTTTYVPTLLPSVDGGWWVTN